MPDSSAISLIPSAVVLRPREEQIFVAVLTSPLAGDTSAIIDANSITWNLSPNVGAIEKDGRYQAPNEVDEDVSVMVKAIDSAPGNRAEAAISLVLPAWGGLGSTLLGVYIILIFFTVFFLIRLWPLESLNPETAKTARIEAEAAVTQTTNDLKAAVSPTDAQSTAQQKPSKSTSSSLTAKQEAQPILSATKAPDSQLEVRSALVERLHASAKRAGDDLVQKKIDESKANSSKVQTSFSNSINREVDLLLLVLLAGMLGAFLHLAQSYSYFVGNRALKRSWLWWYLLQPFIGGGLAFVFYAAMRGGLVSIVSASNASASNLNTCGLVAMCAMVGLFSKAATSKLGEVFETLFQNEAARKAKDKVDNGTKQPVAKSDGSSVAGTDVSNPNR